MAEDKKKLSDELAWKQPNIADAAPEQIEKAQEFCEGYKEFLNHGKTERECVKTAVEMLKKAGYQEFEIGKTYSAGDKIYQVNRNKALVAATIGQKPMDEGVRLNAAHIDSPRLDLKPNPLYESGELSLLKTHYYGGIRKYQWAAIPLSMHGVVVKKGGETVEIHIGDEPGDPVFCVTDLLPHLGAEQSQRKLGEGIKGEELNVVIGSLPYADKEEENRLKLQALYLLHEKYGMTERDFQRAEIEIVPAYPAVDVGLDRSMVGAYGQDDRVCAYTALAAELECQNPVYTSICVLTDKEEIGSVGNTGLNSDYLFHFMEYLAEMQGVNYKTVLRNTKCLSADVNAAYDPTFNSVYEAKNSCYLNKGCVLTKYTGSRGKGGSSDASAEFVSWVADIFDRENVYWQTGELGAVDAGGGGTVALYIAHHNVDVVDLGVPILSMHSPFELASKLDIYNTYAAFQAFLKY